MSETLICPGCGTEIAPRLLSCSVCHRLVHSQRLKELAEEAERAEQAGDFPAALAAWRSALERLPLGTRQYDAIAARIAELGRKAGANPAPAGFPSPVPAHPAAGTGGPSGGVGKAGLAGVGTVGLLLWKFKFIAFIVLTKAKFLLLGLTKASTLFSMLLSMGVYWAAFGWRFAVGLVLSIYVHEMGHVYLLNRFGVKASAPMFIPGLGAMIRVQQSFTDPRQDALVGLAGPIWGLGAAITALVLGTVTGEPYFYAIARLGAWINLFNLIPVWQLDGGRAFRALGRSGRWFALAAIAVAWSLSEESLLILLILGGVFRTLSEPAPQRSDRLVLWQYVFLIAALSALTSLPVQLP
jgi:Zn-dependent protease